ncbi:MAG: hypothetical protein HFI67_01755 [Lachnospiraceae bacterium]|nr:hypothetical protein [Lachnospiraceae bacterium]
MTEEQRQGQQKGHKRTREQREEKKSGRWKQKWEAWKKALGMELREHKSSFLVFSILRFLVVVTIILQFFNKNYENVYVCFLTLLLLVVPSLVQVTIKVELPTGLEIIMLLFIFSAEILGEINAFYLRIPAWDTILHTMNGFLMAAIGFSLVDILNRHERFSFQLSPVFMAVVAFCFSMTIGVLWEFFEWGMDMFFHLDMQKDTILHTISSVVLNPDGANVPVVISGIQDMAIDGQSLGLGGYLDIGLYDTMKDLFVNFIGAVVFSTVGFFYVKNRGKGSFARRFIPRLKNKDKDFLAIAEEEENNHD